ncbi:MAG: long-chain fatty acid--CoA ligase [Candidatus Pelagibacter sp.]|nr:long-chain fatty acid--CoA ligase [Candidatus Pelagibacter sp.]|tara:strand:- start:41735 stop:43429 length:1695 start_codon:yes stop_codon:yes gene_type:complete
MKFDNKNNLFEIFSENYKKNQNKDFLHFLENGKYKPLKWEETNQKINSLSNFFSENNVIKGDRILLVSENRPEWLISDLAIINLGAITVPNYTTYTEKDFSFVIKNCTPKGLIVSNSQLFEKVMSAAKGLSYDFKFVIQFESGSLSNVKYYNDIKNSNFASKDKISRKDPACIIYTSGTQGNPKGVILSHGGIISNCEGALEIVKKIKKENFKFLTWLPLSHSYEHTIQFVQIAVGAKIYYSTKIEQLLENIKLAKPDIMTAVPRFYNNLYNKMNTGASKASSIKKWLFFQTVKIGSKIFLEKSTSFKEKLINILVDILVRKKVNKNFGGNLKAFVSGGGPLDSNVGIFLNALGLKTLQGYGLTETSPVVTCNPIDKIKIDTVGLPLKNVKVKIAPDGEILVKGENIMLGYWKNENATQEILKNQWLYTGDIGEMDSDGYLKITDRKKDIIVSSGGDNISPSKIENLLCLNNEIEQAYVHGDNEKYLSCLLVLNKNLEINNEQIKIIIENVNKNLTIVEKIKKFHVIDEEFTIENDLMTPTMKIKRHKIKDKYKNILENFYKKN